MTAFITVEELAAFLNPRAPRDLSGDVLALLAIEAACDACRTITEQELDLNEDDTAIFRASGKRRDLILPQMPVLAIDEVRVDGEVELEWELMKGGLLRRTGTSNVLAVPKWPAGIIEVDYSHGYVTEGSAVTMPPALRLLAITLAARAYEQGTARQESTGATAVTYSVAAPLDLTDGERAILYRYRHPKADEIEQRGESS